MALSDRRSVYDTVEVDGNMEIDFLSSPFTLYDFTENATEFTVPSFMVGRLDLVAFVAYDKRWRYWWLIAEANDIIDPMSDMYVGQRLVIPSLEKYFNFYNANA